MALAVVVAVAVAMKILAYKLHYNPKNGEKIGKSRNKKRTTKMCMKKTYKFYIIRVCYKIKAPLCEFTVIKKVQNGYIFKLLQKKNY